MSRHWLDSTADCGKPHVRGGLTGAIPSVLPDQLGQDVLPQLTYRLRHALRAPLRRPTAAAVILRFNFSRAEALFE